MTETVRIAIDAMGGDHGPSVVVAGAAVALQRHPDAQFVLVGDEAQVRAALTAHPALAARSRVIHTDVAIRMDDKPSQALRYGRRVSSMWVAIEQVKRGEADVAVSAGNTGALMAMAKFCLKSLEGIDRPAIAALWPTVRGESVVLDVGATIGADAQHLVDLAVMGAAMARIVFDLEKPTVGLLNIGVEEVKGLEMVREAGRILREGSFDHLSYQGFVEGTDIGKGTCDVVVTEGFAGNIALKAAEGTAKQIGSYLRSAMTRTWRARLGYLLARPAFDTLKEKMDPRRANGGVFLGLNGIVIKSHGGADADGFAAAVDLGYDMVRHALQAKINEMIGADLACRKSVDPAPAAPETAS
jgi:glycerol-3-phosphate acyltransferase PlsX